MTDPDDLPTRVTRLEQEMAEVRVLARGADEDCSNMQDTFRAHTGVLNALRQTQLEQGATLAEHSRKLDKIDDRFDKIDYRFIKVEGELGKANAGIAHITALLTNKSNESDEE